MARRPAGLARFELRWRPLWRRCRRPLATRLVGGVAVVACLLALGGSAAARILASDGFSPARNGFSFANYGPGYANLAPAQMQLLFGNGVCAFISKSGGCVLTPPAQRYMDQANQFMATAGHCFGFSTLSLLLWRHAVPQFAGTPTSRIRLRGDTALQRAIAYTFEWQNLPVVQAAWVNGTPNQELQFLIGALRRRRGELYTMAIFQPGFNGGHAITPYAVDSRGRGKYDVLVYDNNWPDQARRVHFDTKTDSWSYVAAVNPSDPGSLYRGNARTGTLSLVPLTPGLGVHFCPFCADTTSGRASYSEIWLQGNPVNHGHLLIHDLTDEQHKIGYDHGRFRTQFPGAHANFQTSFSDLNQRPTPHYILPPNGDEDVTLDGYGLKYPDTETFTLIGQKHYVGIDRIQVRPNATERIVLKVSDESLTYFHDPSQTTSPVFRIGLVGAPGNFTIIVRAQSLHPDSVIRMQDVLANSLPHGRADPAAAIQLIHDSSASGQTFDIQMTRQVGGKVENLSDVSVDQPPGQTVNLYYEQSENGRPVVTVN